jgi:putative membrane protein
MAVIASIFVALAALLHGYIFLLESVRWTHPRTWRIFGVPNQEQADILKPMAYNQGFYNLFLGLGAAIGLVLYWSGAVAPGLTLMLFTTACMALAAAVLATGGRRYVRPALVQGTLPLIGFVLFLLA